VSFDTVLMVDWSGGNDRGPTPKKDAIWACAAREGIADEPIYMRNRQVAEAWITEFLQAEQDAGRRVLAGFDFAFGYPMIRLRFGIGLRHMWRMPQRQITDLI